MNLVRRGFVHLLSVVLLGALVFGVLATSITINLSHPAKIETWLSQSQLYDGFVKNAIQQGLAASSNSSSTQSTGGISLNDVAVQQAASSAFSPDLLQKDVNTFLNSNYDWLEGKTTKPNFIIDLSGAKLSFAEQIGHYVQLHLASLPVCTAAQTAALSPNIDPLSVSCRPASLNPVTEGASTTATLNGSDGFLSNPVLTASSINPNANGNSTPYYQKLSSAPKAYRLATKLPLALGLLALLSAVGIFFIAPRKRKGLRRIGVVLIEAGVILVALKFVADQVFTKLEAHVFNNASVGQLQIALTDFGHRAETALLNVPLYAGIGFIVLALIIFGILIGTRGRNAGGKGRHMADLAGNVADSETVDAPVHSNQQRPVVNDMLAPRSKPTTAPTLPTKSTSSPARPKRPRLIQ